MHNAAMVRWAKPVLLGLSLLVVALGAALLALHFWITTDDFRIRVQQRASAALGVPFGFDRLEVDPWPVPGVAVRNARVMTASVLSAHRIELRPAWRELISGRLVLATLLVRDANLPQAGIDELAETRAKLEPPGKDHPREDANAAPVLPRRVVLDNVRWQRKAGDTLAINADAVFSRTDGMLERMTLTLLDGPFKKANLGLHRNAEIAQVWDVSANLAGGTIKGPVEFSAPSAAAEKLIVKGNLTTRDVELGKLGSGKLTGQLDATTSFNTKAATAGALAEALQSQSTFNVRNALVQGIDLAQAVKSVGLSRGGQTHLDTLAGQVSTRGANIALNNLVASSGALTASGNITVAASRALGGRVAVRLGAGPLGEVAGVPLVVGGTLDNPELTLTRGAMLGAAVGTLVMPGVGTGAGANLGDRIGGKLKGLFGK